MQKNDVEETDVKRVEWVHLQQELAARVHVPRTEVYCPLPTASPAVWCKSLSDLWKPREDGEFDLAFVHRHFLLPKELLHSESKLSQNPPKLDKLSTTEYYHFAYEILSRQIVWDINRQDKWEEEAILSEGQTSFRQFPSSHLSPLKIVGGVDISTIAGTPYGVACLTIHAFPSLDLLGKFLHHCELKEPYISCFLAFREVQPIIELFDRVRGALEEKGWMPQLLLVDGCGVNHPRRCGLASHLGVLLNLPTIGCSKNMLSVGGLSREDVESYFRTVAGESPSGNAQSEGDGGAKRRTHSASFSSSLVARMLPPLHPILVKSSLFPSFSSSVSSDDVALVGYAVQTSKSSKRCIFVSPGNEVGYATSVGLVLRMCRHRVPEPIRTADLLSRDYIRSMNLAEELKKGGIESAQNFLNVD
ncbi:unnamed protein product [Phytomonas sp. Hart1]|nr:unnamed protein product [Phytomonas sp. Hart1]|eukprot:CCW66936.1 unnamed protein product [Phytomonas sp. isolate Hart1]